MFFLHTQPGKTFIYLKYQQGMIMQTLQHADYQQVTGGTLTAPDYVSPIDRESFRDEYLKQQRGEHNPPSPPIHWLLKTN